MKVCIVNFDHLKGINKDTAGGFGTKFSVGTSLFSKIIERMKWKIKIPIVISGYIASIFLEFGWTVCTNCGENYPQSDFYVIPITIVDFENELRIAKLAKEQYNAKIILWGPFLKVFYNKVKDFADAVIVGEPESSISEIARTKQIKEKILFSNPVENLDKLPFPNWNVFDISKYNYWTVIKAKPFLPILSSRGCPYPCKFYCPYPVSQGTALRLRSVKNVSDEIKYLVDRYNIRGLVFRDPIFTLRRERALNIAKEISKNKNSIEWGIETRIDSLDEYLINYMADAGLKSIECGIESFNDATLIKNFRNNNTTINEIEKVVSFCNKKKISLTLFYIIGLPNSSVKDVKETIRIAKSINSLGVQFTIFTPYPGTPFFKKTYGNRIPKNIKEFDSFTPVFSNINHDVLLKLKEYAFVSYYFRTKWLGKYFLRIFR